MLHEAPSVAYRRIGLAVLGLLAFTFVSLACSAAPAAEEPYQPSEGTSATCVSHCDCPPGELCQPNGDTGECRPAACPEIWKPVCGLDGQTYGNRCEADAAHVVVAHDGECREQPDGQPCGGIRGLTCPRGEFCELPEGMCRGADLMGVCVEQPQACPRIFRPVCGCDGKTYPNDCERRRAGVQKDHDGECGSAECSNDRQCGEGNYCEFTLGTCEAPGMCETRPEICTQEFLPVCGCDGKTYGNACQAAAAGVSVRAKGECKG